MLARYPSSLTNQLGLGKRRWSLETSSAVVEFPPPSHIKENRDACTMNSLILLLLLELMEHFVKNLVV